MKKWQKDFLYYVSKDNYNNFEQDLKLSKSIYFPKKIYKYCYFDENNYAIENLIQNKFYLNSPDYFNDPYDCFICYFFNDTMLDLATHYIENSCNIDDIDKQKIFNLLSDGFNIFEIKNKYKTDDIIAEEIDFIIEDIQNEIENIFIKKIRDYFYKYMRISCFSEKCNNILMWAHYAKNHTGFCIEYDLAHLKFDKFKEKLYPVFYSNKPIRKFESESDIKDYSFFLMTALTKFKDWAYEKEWRFLSNSTENDFFIMPHKPSKIYLGSKINDENRNKITQICKQKKIACHKMVIRADSFYVQPSL